MSESNHVSNNDALRIKTILESLEYLYNNESEDDLTRTYKQTEVYESFRIFLPRLKQICNTLGISWDINLNHFKDAVFGCRMIETYGICPADHVLDSEMTAGHLEYEADIRNQLEAIQNFQKVMVNIKLQHEESSNGKEIEHINSEPQATFQKQHEDNPEITIRDLAKIFRSWKEHAEKGTFKDDDEGARKLIAEGLDKGARAWPLMNSLQNEYGLPREDPENRNASAYMALSDLGDRMTGEPKEEIENHENQLLEELTGLRPWGLVQDYLALANELDRWADKLAKLQSSDVSAFAESNTPKPESIEKPTKHISTPGTLNQPQILIDNGAEEYKPPADDTSPKKIKICHGTGPHEFNDSKSIQILRDAINNRGIGHKMNRSTFQSFKKNIKKKLPDKEAEYLIKSIKYSDNAICIKENINLPLEFNGFEKK